MTKQRKNKLVLDRETVATLQSDALEGVAGGVAASGCIPPSLGLVGCGGGLSRQVSQISQISRQVSFGGR